MWWTAILQNIGGITAAAKEPIAGVIGSQSKAARWHRKTLRADQAAYDAGQLGLSDAQKQQMAGAAQEQVQASLQPQANEIARQQAAMGFGRSGAATAATGQLANATAGATAGAMKNIEALSQEQVARKQADVVGRTAAQRQKIQTDWNNWAESAKKDRAANNQAGSALAAAYGNASSFDSKTAKTGQPVEEGAGVTPEYKDAAGRVMSGVSY